MKCKVCQREIRERVDGECLYVMELEPGVFKRCLLPRNAQTAPIDPHSWFGGFDHLRDDRDVPICGCGHMKTEHANGVCQPCNLIEHEWANSGHRYQPGAIALDHEARK